MSSAIQLKPIFVKFIPAELESGVLYISMEYTITAHLCASGCGGKITLPLSPAQWHLFFDGETVSLSPSVGNWDLPCQSHYWIRNNNIHWAEKWDEKRIKAGRVNDAHAIDTHFKERTSQQSHDTAHTPHIPWWRRLFKK